MPVVALAHQATMARPVAVAAVQEVVVAAEFSVRARTALSAPV